MTMTSKPISIARQLELLLNTTLPLDTRPMTVKDAATAIGVTQHTLLNILHGRIDNPRLFTLRSLCVFYGISLDYFDLPTEEQCRLYLARQHLRTASPLVQKIYAESDDLKPGGYRNILSALKWIRAATLPKKT
jgi:transcriptional regulator with XRE-family HTH domain